MAFRQKIVWKKKEYTKWEWLIDRSQVRKLVLGAVVIFWWMFVFWQVWNSWKWVIASISKETVKAVAKQAWESMTQDTTWNINVLVVWYAGEWERWGYLTDTVMVASFNPELWTVTFLSIPRDLYVTYHKGWRWRMNGVYRAKYIDSWDSHEEWAKYLMKKVWQITWIDLEYYAFVSFDWFTDFIDSLWWVTIDVPEDLIDPYYPTNDNGFQTLTIKQGTQTLDGDLALKYARSRKTTSDFSRTIRQQQIIKWVVNQVIWSMWLSNISKAKNLYDDALKVINTNISSKEILWMVKHLESNKRFFSFVYTADCDKRYFEISYPWCLLVNGNREEYGGQSVILPIWATPWNINYYKHTKDFAFRVIHNQEFLLENAPIRVFNWIDKKRARRNGYPIEWIATKLAIDLKTQAFNVLDIANSDELVEKSVVYVPDLASYSSTIDLLRIFVDIDEVKLYEPGKEYEWITIIMWNDYMFDR